MRKVTLCLALLMTAPAHAGPDLECGGTSQVEIGACVSEMRDRVDTALEVALGFARTAADELDEVTGRSEARPALETAQQAWDAYRTAHCDFIGATFGGGSGTGIAISSCHVVLGRARVDVLLQHAQY